VVSVVVELGAGWLTVLSSLVVVVVEAGCSLAQPVTAIIGIAARQQRKRFFIRSCLGEDAR
jgi:hypothetical protein